MKKTISISIGGMSFQVEEDAYQRLENYLTRVKAHFAALNGSSEIVSDIEDRLAEQFSAKVGINGIVTLSLVDEMIAQMGEPEAFGSEPSLRSEKQTVSRVSGKRLMRNPDDVIIAGVASGLAVYIGVDPIWVRLVFAVSIFFGGFGVVAYIILWIVMPEAKTEIEKMQMKGEPINLKAIENTVKERVEELKKKDSNRIKSILAAPFKLLGAILRGVVPVLGKIIGAVIAIAGAFGLAGLVLVAVSLLFNADSPYVDFPLKEIAHGVWYVAAVVGLFLTAFIPVMLVALLGTSLLSGKASASRGAMLGMFAVWVLAISISASSAIKLAPQAEIAIKNSGYYETEARTIEAKNFNAVQAESAYRLNIVKGESFSVTAKGRKADLDQMLVRVEEGVLKAGNNEKFRICLFCFGRSAEIEIMAPDLSSLELSGASQAAVSGFEVKEFKLKFSGASRASLDIAAEVLNAELSGASRIKATGTVENINAKLSGASRAEFQDALVKNAEFQLSGASRVLLKDVKNLTAGLSGASRVYYASAENIDSDTSGSSSLIRDENPQPDNPDDFYFYPPGARLEKFKDQHIEFSYESELVPLPSDSPGAIDSTSSLLEGKNVLLLGLPKEQYHGTNLSSAYALVSKVENLSNTASCSAYLGPDGKENELKEKETVNGVKWYRTELSTAAAGTRRFQEIFHTGQDKACYEISLNLFTSNPGNYPLGTILEIDREEVWAKFRPLVETFKFVK